MKGWPGEPEMDYDVIVAQDAARASEHEPITDVIFDFGNVLVYWDPASALLPRYSQHTVDRFLDNDISGFYDANDRMDAGGSTGDAVEWVRHTHGDLWADMLQYYLDNFEDSLIGVVPGARVLVNDLKKAGIGVWGLSNWDRSLFPLAKDYCPILKELNGVVVSGFVGLRKPDPQIYRHALGDFGISAEHSVFIDDKAMNIVGANAVGLRGIRFRDPRILRTRLIEAGIPIPAVADL